MTDEHEKAKGYFDPAIEDIKRDIFLRGLIERERRILDSWGNCECSQAPLCPYFLRPGELFKDGLPESVVLP